ncbi:Chromosome partition protein Smc [Salinisphaera shabanensis E1L3A]|uniref:Chromosome partition protein Smc n=1 Tax=Salinisphaera shabanensis E1L3A TaxID=1033802 RepID=U2E4A5_9GAMM|nr:chromosome segregation protein SMC [Salinisphaera shabanensis]ERJ18681.1 Chromosome partition protein Smc [Salinisphaera shabanensis E1L3A]
MRLTSIRLAGFKSFVDPATLALNSNLTGVVGPNGCGKSNVIDAVRWVTGESSARQLRGEALEDVIFNGSKARKPVGRASVELKFDNSDATLTGQYGAFSEISVKRELSRDGGSRYYINGTKSRRRDVIDLFLGTGLGGRSNYAVIEQGAVNRLIEAKPEDMRQVLEEAAGISKYKERRRETENRMRHTRENLDRLNDLIGEVTQRLGVLKRQAANAEKYKQFKAEERRLRAELLALRWAAENEKVEVAEGRLRASEHELREAISTQRSAQQARAAEAESQQKAMGAVQTQQAAFYDAQAQASRIAQALAHAKEMRELRERERDELVERRDALAKRIAEDEHAEHDTVSAAEAIATEHDEAQRALTQAREALDGAEKAAREAESAWDAHNSAEQNPVQQLDAERRRARYAEERVQQLGARRDKRRGERDKLDDEDTGDLAAGARDIESRAGQLAEDEKTAANQAESDDALRAAINDAEADVEARRTQLGETRARLASERQLQQSVLREDDATLAQWLADNAQTEAAGVARRVKVRGPWQTAAEAVLGPWLRGFVVERLPALAGDWPSESLTLVESGPADPVGAARGPADTPSLAEGIEAPAVIAALAARVFVVDDLAAALEYRHELTEDQRFVTLDGCCIGPHSLVTPAAGSAEQGVLEREQRIETLAVQIDAEQAELDSLQETLDGQREQRDERREQRRALEQRIAQARRELEAARAEQQGREIRAEQLARRRKELDNELADLENQITEAAGEFERLSAQVTALEDKAEAFSAARREAQAQLAESRAARDAARKAYAQAERALREIETRSEQNRSRAESIAQRLADTRDARSDVETRLAGFDDDSAASDKEATPAPDESEHEQALEAQHRAERELRAARESLKASEKALDEASQRQMQAEQGVETAREGLQQAKIDVETTRVRRAGIAEQIEELGETPAALVANLEDGATIETRTAAIETIERKIQRLGAINLAAIEEYDAEAERERYLGEQHADLSEALETLETAIARIDRETRARFKATYEQVNERFAGMFPELFGGGEAALELTEDDWLVTGIRVMARPPGKRNASIQMLSGGEKALTAVALLFALFELNPAPFCMLDEIDAPLDDANVSRFCELVRRMSAQVQFIVITHNKLTMSLAEQLHGVTMAEPGVSRLVSVDIDQALDMAG